MLEGGLAVVGKERQVQPGGMTADGQTAGGGHGVAIGAGAHHGVAEGALVRAVQAGVLGDEGQELLQGQVGLILLGLIKPLAVIQQRAAQADHILLGAEGAYAGAVACRHGGISFRGSVIIGIFDGDGESSCWQPRREARVWGRSAASRT